jgi:hypothetical protein
MMPAILPSYTEPTGKNNVLTSINKWLQANVPPANDADFKYIFTSEVAPVVFPMVTVTEFPFFDPGFNAMGNVLFNAANYTSDQGRINHLMLDINIYTSNAVDPNAKRNMLRIRDRIISGLTKAGLYDDDTNVQLAPPISVLDYDNGAADTGTVARVAIEEANYAIERYYPPSADVPDVHRYQLLVKIQYFEMF